MKLVIGLGNPDKEYGETRHNIGFMALEYLAKKAGAGDFELNKKLDALVTKGKLNDVTTILAKPIIYVNKSGLAAAKLSKFYKVKPENIIIVQDDLDIEFGSIKSSYDKNSGGHKGVGSVIRALKTKKFHRIRIGTAIRALQKARSSGAKTRDAFVQKFVLSKFTPSERKTLKKIFKMVLERLRLII